MRTAAATGCPHRPLAVAGASGFTLLEVLIVVVVLGVLAGLAYPRFTANTYAAASFLDQTAAALRYAQRYAVATGCAVEVELDAGSETLSLSRRSGGDDVSCGDGGFSVLLPLPGQSGDYQVSAPSNVDVSAGFSVVFDAEGVPDSGANAVIGGRNLTVEAGSGYVH